MPIDRMKLVDSVRLPSTQVKEWGWKYITFM